MEVQGRNFRRVVSRPNLDRRSLLVGMALVLVFSTALALRVLPARYGFYLNEFDPYFNYYATRFIVDHVSVAGLGGLLDYFSWHDTQTWFPEGRSVAVTSQVGLHLTAALLFLFFKNVFGLTLLYDFLVLFPIFFGALTTLTLFLLVKRIGGTGAGLFAALILAVSPAIIQRGNLGWFKSEPLALFLTTLAAYLFLSAYDTNSTSRAYIWRAALAGGLLGYANTAWGGSQFFSLVVGLLLFVVPFLDINLKRMAGLGISLVGSNLLVSALLPRPGPAYIMSPGGLVMLAGLGFAILVLAVKSSSDTSRHPSILVKTILAAGVACLGFLSFVAITPLSGRYTTVLYPYLRNIDPLVESVAEHAIPTGSENFAVFFILIFLSGFGALILMRKRNLPAYFALIFAISAIYVASSFSRLLVFSALAFAILGSVGLMELISSALRPPSTVAGRKKLKILDSRSKARFSFAVVMILLLTVPLVYPSGQNWISTADIPVSIASSSLPIREPVPDWMEALAWISENTPSESVIAAWWDYGYWISVMGNRTTLVDNATINSTKIGLLGKMFMSNETTALNLLDQLTVDPHNDQQRPAYVTVFVAGQKFVDHRSGQTIYILGGGGDESKQIWFIRIGLGRDRVNDFLYEDGISPRPELWQNTFLGQLLPFRFEEYAARNEGFLRSQGPDAEWQNGFRGLYSYEVKYDDDSVDPMVLAFASSGLTTPAKTQALEQFAGVLVYERVNETQ